MVKHGWFQGPYSPQLQAQAGQLQFLWELLQATASAAGPHSLGSAPLATAAVASLQGNRSTQAAAVLCCSWLLSMVPREQHQLLLPVVAVV